MGRPTDSSGGPRSTPPTAEAGGATRDHASRRSPESRAARIGSTGSAANDVDDLDAADARSTVVFRYRVEPEPGLDFISDSVLDVSGYSPDEYYADPYLAYALIHPDDLPLLLQLDPVADANRPLLLRWVRRDRHVIWTRHLHAPVLDASGRVIAVEGVARDVTASVLEDLGIEQPVLGRGAGPLLSVVHGAPAGDDRRR